MRSPTQALPAADFREVPNYYLVGHVSATPVDADEPVIVIGGHAVRASHLMVAITPFENLVHMYDYIPNQKIWVRNSALEDAYWQIGFDSFDTVFKEVDKDTALTYASRMKDYSDLLISMTLHDIGTDFLPHATVLGLP